MENKQKILQLFNEVAVKTHSDAWDKVIEEEDWDMIADEIVKLFSMSDVVGQSEQLCQHEWIDARNEVIKSGHVCLKCNSVKA